MAPEVYIGRELWARLRQEAFPTDSKIVTLSQGVLTGVREVTSRGLIVHVKSFENCNNFNGAELTSLVSKSLDKYGETVVGWFASHISNISEVPPHYHLALRKALDSVSSSLASECGRRAVANDLKKTEAGETTVEDMIGLIVLPLVACGDIPCRPSMPDDEPARYGFRMFYEIREGRDTDSTPDWKRAVDNAAERKNMYRWMPNLKNDQICGEYLDAIDKFFPHLKRPIIEGTTVDDSHDRPSPMKRQQSSVEEADERLRIGSENAHPAGNEVTGNSILTPPGSVPSSPRKESPLSKLVCHSQGFHVLQGTAGSFQRSILEKKSWQNRRYTSEEDFIALCTSPSTDPDVILRNLNAYRVQDNAQAQSLKRRRTQKGTEHAKVESTSASLDCASTMGYIGFTGVRSDGGDFVEANIKAEGQRANLGATAPERGSELDEEAVRRDVVDSSTGEQADIVNRFKSALCGRCPNVRGWASKSIEKRVKIEEDLNLTAEYLDRYSELNRSFDETRSFLRVLSLPSESILYHLQAMNDADLVNENIDIALRSIAEEHSGKHTDDASPGHHNVQDEHVDEDREYSVRKDDTHRTPTSEKAYGAISLRTPSPSPHNNLPKPQRSLSPPSPSPPMKCIFSSQSATGTPERSGHPIGEPNVPQVASSVFCKTEDIPRSTDLARTTPRKVSSRNGAKRSTEQPGAYSPVNSALRVLAVFGKDDMGGIVPDYISESISG